MMDEDDPKKGKKRGGLEDRGESGDGDSGGPDRPKGVDFKSSRFLFIILVLGVIVAVFAGSKTMIYSRPEQVDWTQFVQMMDEGRL